MLLYLGIVTYLLMGLGLIALLQDSEDYIKYNGIQWTCTTIINIIGWPFMLIVAPLAIVAYHIDNKLHIYKEKKRIEGNKKEIMHYKGYPGSIKYNRDDDIFHGKIESICSWISYQGKSTKELRENFEESVNMYLQLCKDENILPEKPIKNSTVKEKSGK